MTSGQTDRAIVVLNQAVEGAAEDIGPRLLRARTYLLRSDASNALLDLNYVLNFSPGNAEALMLRGIALTATRQYDQALADLTQALGKFETIEGYFSRGKIYEVKNDVPHATSDFRRAAELKPKNIFDILVQVEATKRAQQLSKRLPCDNSNRARNDASCL
jgi:tetratricopeptide (TPR) repeat protein